MLAQSKDFFLAQSSEFIHYYFILKHELHLYYKPPFILFPVESFLQHMYIRTGFIFFINSATNSSKIFYLGSRTCLSSFSVI